MTMKQQLKFMCLNASEWLLAAFQLISTIVFLRLCAIVFRLNNDNVKTQKVTYLLSMSKQSSSQHTKWERKKTCDD